MIRIALIVVSLLGMSFFVKAHISGNIIKASYQEKTGSRYCIVVGSFSSLEKAQKYGALAQAKGYDVSYRDNGKGFYRVCVFDLASGAEAQKRIDELKSKDDIFNQSWILKCDDAVVVPQKHEGTVQPAESSSPATTVQPVAETKKKVEEEKPKQMVKTTPVPETKIPDKKTEKEYAHYCVVVGRFTTPDEAKTFGESVQKNGFGVFFRKDENGSVLVCMYDLKTRPDADKRIDKMRHINGIFAKSWVLGYDNTAENISIDKL